MPEKKSFSPETIEDQPFLTKKISEGVKGSYFNTVSKLIHGIFKFSEKGGIQIGDIKTGVSGKILLDIDGFHGYDTSGLESITVFQSGGIRFRGSNTISFYPSDSDDLTGIFGVHEGIEGLAGINLSSNYWLNLYADEAIACFADLEVGVFTFPAGWVAKFSVDEETGDTYIAGTLEVDGLITGTITEAQHALIADELAGGGGIPDYAYAAGCIVDLYDSNRIIDAYKNNGSIEFATYKPGEAIVFKTAIVPTSKGYRSLYCMESPDVWFMDFCRGFKKRKWPKFWQTEWEITPSKLFLETIEPPIIVMPTLQKGIVQIWGRRKGCKDMRFKKKTKEEFEKNKEFWGKASVKKPEQKQSK